MSSCTALCYTILYNTTLYYAAAMMCKGGHAKILRTDKSRWVVADVWEKDMWDFQAKSGSSGSCPLFLHFQRKIAVRRMSVQRAENGGLDPSWLGCPKKREIQPQQIQPPILGPLSCENAWKSQTSFYQTSGTSVKHEGERSAPSAMREGAARLAPELGTRPATGKAQASFERETAPVFFSTLCMPQCDVRKLGTGSE